MRSTEKGACISSERVSEPIPRKQRFFKSAAVPIALLAIALVPSLIAYRDTRSLGSRDFRNLYAGGLLLREGRLYDLQREAQVQAAVTHGPLETPVPYSHPPFVALLMVPFTFISYSPAYYAMLACNILILALSCWLLSERFQFNVMQIKAMTFTTVAYFPLYGTLLQGQLSLVALLLVTLFVADLDRGRRPGYWVGLLCFKPSLMLVPFLVLVFRRKWKVLWLGCLLVFGFSCLSVLLVGWGGIRRWIEVLRFVSTSPQLSSTRLAMSNLRGLSLFLTGGSTISVLLTLGVLVILWLRRKNHLLIVVATILVSPHLYTHDLAIGLVAVAIAVFLSPQDYLTWAAIAALPPFIALSIHGAFGITLPIVPVTLLSVFCVCAWSDWGNVHFGNHSTIASEKKEAQ